MAVCEVCGNDYRLAFEVRAAGAVHVFDSFECAAHRLAPRCENCGVTVLGHGVEADGVFYCCAHCGRQGGRSSGAGLVDSSGDPPVLDQR
jgi:Zn finger protein HypA/HybF involved in hydrogenase expression